MLLSVNEQKVVLATLTKHRAALRKALEDSGLETEQRLEYIETLKLLDCAMKKLSSTATLPATPSTHTSGRAAPRAVPIADARVLVAEDDDTSAFMLMEALEEFGIRGAEHAKDGSEALEKIASAEMAYDIILCDWGLPKVNGLDVHRQAKAADTLRGAHFIMVTGVSEAAKIREAVSEGVDDYIVKPIDLAVLATKIKAVLHSE